MNGLFLDTGPLVATVSPRDANREDALALLDRIRSREWSTVVTSDYVLTETLNFVARKIRRRDAARAVRVHVFGDAKARPIVTHVARVHAGRFAQALERFEKNFDAGLSFTDWTNLVTMEDERITTIATFDHGFDPWARVVPETGRRPSKQTRPTRRARNR